MSFTTIYALSWEVQKSRWCIDVYIRVGLYYISDTCAFLCLVNTMRAFEVLCDGYSEHKL